MVKFFRKYVLDNWGLKLLSLAVAVMLWWGLAHDPPVDLPMVVPIEFHHVPNHLVMNSEGPLQAEITLRGPQREVRALSPNEIHAVIDLDGAAPGEHTFDLTSKQIRLPHDVEVTSIVPAQFHITFDRNATRTVDVHPRVIGSLVTGYTVTGVSADPSKIVIEGPEQRVDAIDSAVTDPVDATGVVGQATFTTHAYVGDPLVRVQKPMPIHVTVTTGKAARGSGAP